MLFFFTNLGLMGFQVSYLALFFFFSNRQLQAVLDGKSSQEYPVNTGAALQGSIHHHTLFFPQINDLPDDVICNNTIYADDTTLHSKCQKASYLWTGDWGD